ncbi:MAG: 2-oxoacid:acceptor oxidoreductase subunit alpha [Emcibacter sp.]|nr:2-oxoacid:acceptor oxidoreductase subunit alpha [Emcibacter sp.]
MNKYSTDVKSVVKKDNTPLACDDITVVTAGQGGDGSVTVITLLAWALAQRGLHLFSANDIASRIKGGHAAAALRSSRNYRGCLGDNVDILVAFDGEAIEKNGQYLGAESVVIYDTSRGPLPKKFIPDTTRIIEIPFSRFSVRELRRDLFKNCLGFGVLARVMGLSDEEAHASIRHRFKRLTAENIKPNIQALELGFEFAAGHKILTKEEAQSDHGLYKLPHLEREDRIMISGNDATAFGFLAAGGRFFAGYPITPATDIMNWLEKRLPAFGGVVIQGEDELAAINMAIGAALSGAKAMTASSGPGIALMQESVGHCGSAEIPLVIVDCQRAGPSTGMPTKLEQNDLGMLTQGSNGDFPHIVLSPGSPQECFDYGVLATNLSQAAQCPVYIALDGLCQFTYTIPAFDLGDVKIDNGKRLTDEQLAKMSEYQRYAITEDGISPFAVPGQPGGMNLVTGNERNPWGLVSTDPVNRVAMMDKRARKIESVKHQLPIGYIWGDDNAKVGVICMGMIGDVLTEASERLAEKNIAVRCHRPRTLWPILDDTIEFVRECERVYVVECNDSGQLARLIKGAGAPADKIESILQYDGLFMRPGSLVNAILEKEKAL